MSPIDFSFASPNQPPRKPRQPKPGELLWTLTKDGSRKHSELRNGVELQIFLDGEIEYAKRYTVREFALAEAEGCKRDLERSGWQSI